MKIAIITDTHWGTRNDSVQFHNNSKKFLDNIFFPLLDKEGITTVVHLGDLFHKQKYVNTYTASRLRKDFIEPLMQRKIDTHILVGNHDAFFKNTNEVNSVYEVLNQYPLHLYSSAAEVTFDGLNVLFVPWICPDNRVQTLQAIEQTKSQICMGHLELQGFEMYKGSIVSHGDDPRLFDHFDMVLSGHYHHRSTNGHVYYLGAHAEFTWGDYDDPRGIHIFDTNTRDLTFIQNPYKMFKKVWYDDQTEGFTTDIDYDQFADCVVKVIITSKVNHTLYDQFIQQIQSVQPAELHTVEDHLNMSLSDNEQIISEASTTIDIFRTHIEQMDSRGVDKVKLRTLFESLYDEAMSLEQTNGQ